MLRLLQRVRGFGAVLGVALLLGAAACGGGDTPSLDVTVSLEMPESVPLGEPLRMFYDWSVAEGFEAPADDYQVFVHAVDAQGQVVFQDDHYTPEPTSQWQAGQQIAYDRWLYLPEGIEVDQLEFRVGLYSPDSRALLRGDAGTWTDSVTAHRLEVRLDDMSGMPAFLDGWHGLEEVDVPERRSWRWSEAEARAVFTNPRKDAILHITAHGPFDEVGAQELVLSVGEQELARIEIDSASEFSERFEIPAAAMGNDDWVELLLQVSPALVPRELDPESADERTLGVQVFHLYLSSP